MPDPVTPPKPIEKIENLDLLQTDLIAFILKETGIDISEHDSPNVPTFNAEDIERAPVSVMAKAFSSALSTDILDGSSTGMYPAVVLLPFKSGPGGVQSCKAIVPTLHGSADNPFAATDEDERADMISHFPTFSFNDGLSEASSPLVPASIILVSFDNPHNYWASGAIEKVIKGRPDALPEYALAIPDLLEIFNDPIKWLTATIFGAPLDDGTFSYNDSPGKVCQVPPNGELAPALCTSGSRVANCNDGLIEFLRKMAYRCPSSGRHIATMPAKPRRWLPTGTSTEGHPIGRSQPRLHISLNYMEPRQGRRTTMLSSRTTLEERSAKQGKPRQKKYWTMGQRLSHMEQFQQMRLIFE